MARQSRTISPGMFSEMDEARYYDDRNDGYSSDVQWMGVSLSNINQDILKFLWLHIDSNFTSIVDIVNRGSRVHGGHFEIRLQVENKSLGFSQIFNKTIHEREVYEMRTTLSESGNYMERYLTSGFLDYFKETASEYNRAVHNKTTILHIESKDELMAHLCKLHVKDQMDNRNPRR